MGNSPGKKARRMTVLSPVISISNTVQIVETMSKLSKFNFLQATTSVLPLSDLPNMFF
jgi:hypothetical protein